MAIDLNNQIVEDNKKYFKEAQLDFSVDAKGDRGVKQSIAQGNPELGSAKFVSKSFSTYDNNRQAIESGANKLSSKDTLNITKDMGELDKTLAAKRKDLQAGKIVASEAILSPLSEMIAKQAEVLNKISRSSFVEANLTSQTVTKQKQPLSEGINEFSRARESKSQEISKQSNDRIQDLFVSSSEGKSLKFAPGTKPGEQDKQQPLEAKFRFAPDTKLEQSNPKTFSNEVELKSAEIKQNPQSRIKPIQNPAVEIPKQPKTVSFAPGTKTTSIDDPKKPKTVSFAPGTKTTSVDDPKKPEPPTPPNATSKNKGTDRLPILSKAVSSETKTIGHDLSKYMHHLGGKMFTSPPGPEISKNKKMAQQKGNNKGMKL